MAGTIIPMVYGKRATQKVPADLLVYTLGSVAGGVCVGALLSRLGSLIWHRPSGVSSSVVDGAVGLLALVYSLREIDLVNVPAPQPRWRVPRRWVVIRPHGVAALLYGCSLGAGVLTRINACLYPIIAWAVLAGRGVEGSLVMALFALCRTLPLWALYLAAKDTNEHASADKLRVSTCALGQWQPAIQLLNAAALAFAGVLLLTPTASLSGVMPTKPGATRQLGTAASRSSVGVPELREGVWSNEREQTN